MHDLLRLYAKQLSDAYAVADGREQARERLLSYYLKKVRLDWVALDFELQRLARDPVQSAGVWAMRAAPARVRLLVVREHLTVASTLCTGATVAGVRRRALIVYALEFAWDATTAIDTSLAHVSNPAGRSAERRQALVKLSLDQRQYQRILEMLNELS
jgi:hypothetical protein